MIINPGRPRQNFFCNNKHKIAYLQINKSACSTLAGHIARITVGDFKTLWSSDNFDLITSDESLISDYFKFTFVRNPYDRFLSFYMNWVLEPVHDGILERYRGIGLEKNMTFYECSKCIVQVDDIDLLDPHSAPQYSFVYRGNKLRVNYLGNVEQLNQQIEFVNKACEINQDLVCRNRANYASKNANLYTDEIKELIYEFYRKDFELFGYEK